MAEISNNPTAEGTNAWTNPSNGRTSNDSYATCAPGKNLSVSGIWTTFNIVNPGNATITKVEIGHEHKVSTTASIATLGRQITWNGGTNWSTENVLSTALTEVLVDTIYWLDVTAATTWTWTALNNTNLQVRIRAIQGNSSTAVTFSLDAIWVRVTYVLPAEAYAAEAILNYVAPTEVYAAEAILAYMAPAETYAAEAILDYNVSTLPCEVYAAECILDYDPPPCEVYAAEAILDYVGPAEVYAAECILNYEPPPCEVYAAEAMLDYVAPCEVYAAEVVLNYEPPPCEVYATEVILDYEVPATTPCEVYAAEAILDYNTFEPCEVYAAEAVLDYEIPTLSPCEVYAAEVVLEYSEPLLGGWRGWVRYHITNYREFGTVDTVYPRPPLDLGKDKTGERPRGLKDR